MIGEDPEYDAERFFRTENGITLVTQDALRRLSERCTSRHTAKNN